MHLQSPSSSSSSSCHSVGALSKLKTLHTSGNVKRPIKNITVRISRGQNGTKELGEFGRYPAVSSVNGVRARGLLSPDLHIKRNRLTQKKRSDHASQTAGIARKSHIFQNGSVEV